MSHEGQVGRAIEWLNLGARLRWSRGLGMVRTLEVVHRVQKGQSWSGSRELRAEKIMTLERGLLQKWFLRGSRGMASTDGLGHGWAG